MSKISNKKFGIFNNKQVILTTLNSEQNTKVSFMNWGHQFKIGLSTILKMG